jgi:hypothetical protein
MLDAIAKPISSLYFAGILDSPNSYFLNKGHSEGLS